MSGSVTAQSLLRGAVYSLEHCGELLRDAKALYENGSYATALAVGAFAREDLGRWRMLLKLRKRALAGESLTVGYVRDACDDHVSKQEAGMTSLTTRSNNESGVGKLLQTRFKAPLGSKERREADKQIAKLDQVKSKRTPNDRHQLRMKALYVDILSEEDWNRPAQEILQTDAYDFLVDAMNDYRLQRSQQYMELEILQAFDPELHDALVQWPDRPKLPHVEPPTYPGVTASSRYARMVREAARLAEIDLHPAAQFHPIDDRRRRSRHRPRQGQGARPRRAAAVSYWS
jgi:AbiV family abortive infection protein